MSENSPSQPEVARGGTGIDGKPYQTHGTCGARTEVSNVIVIANDMKAAKLVRKDCQDLPAPEEVPVAELQFSMSDSSILKFKEKAFDRKVMGPQTVTNAFCESPDASVHAVIWETAGQPGVKFGRVVHRSGSTSGPLVMQAAGLQYQSVAGQASQITLDVAGKVLRYALTGGTSASVANLSCGTQSSPSAIASSALAAPAGYSPALLVFEDRFQAASLDSSKWIPEIADQNGVWRQSVPAPFSASNAGGFNAEFFDPGRVVTGNGLSLVATRDTSFAGYSWRSGVVTTHGKFSFNGGYAQFRAKMPDSSSGMWASIFFLEGGANIGLQASGFLGANPNRMMLSNVTAPGNSQNLSDTGVDLSADYHVYGMEYRPDESIKIYLDGVLMRTYSANVPTGAYTIAIALQIAQNAAAWHTGVSALTPAQNVFEVSDVQVYRLPP